MFDAHTSSDFVTCRNMLPPYKMNFLPFPLHDSSNMTFSARRKFLTTAVFSAIAAVTGTTAHAQAYPSKPIQLVVPFAAGGAADLLARMWGDFVGKSLGTTVVIDNRAGANGSIGAVYAARQPADGYTVFYGGISTLVFNKYTYRNLPYNPDKDFTPVTLLANVPLMMVANPQSGISNFADFIAKAKADPGGLKFGSAGLGNSTHMFVELTGSRFGLELLHVPYKGMSPATNDLLGGQLDFVVDVAASTVGNVSTGKVKPIVMYASKRLPQFANVPTIGELGFPEFPVSGWYGLAVPTGTPPSVIATLDSATRKFWADPTVRAKMEDRMIEAVPSGPQPMKAWTAQSDKIWGPVIEKIGVKND
jgi:tripartite-type tricarboxylate transporter receptor subunit TctC